MQNKGLIKVFTVLLALICAFYLSFSFVTSYHISKARKAATVDDVFNENRFNQIIDSLQTEKVWFGYTFREARMREVNLGLDLKGGMNVIMEVSVPDILRALSGNSTDPNFNRALEMATAKQSQTGGGNKDFLDLFAESYSQLDPNAQLAVIFSTVDLRDKIRPGDSNAAVMKVLKDQVSSAIDNSFNVLRNRIDRFGVVQPNIQKLDVSGRILIELPGIKEPERVRKLLQGTANLEFWETTNLNEIYQNLMAANNVIRDLHLAKTDTVAVATQAADTTAMAVNAPANAAVSQLDSLKALAQQQTDTIAQAQQEAEWRKNNPLFGVLKVGQTIVKDDKGKEQIVQSSPQSPVVGMAAATDTTQINRFLEMRQVRDVLPRNLRLKWTVKSIDEKGKFFQLIAIRATMRDGRLGPALEGDVITDARADIQQGSAYSSVSMSMNNEGARVWARLTKDNIGRSIAIVLDNYVYSFPTVNTEIPNGHSQITGNFSPEEAQDLANTLKSGKMPAPARIVQEDVIGPSLGQEAIKDGVIAFIVAFIFILIYMVVYYGRKPGLIADVALLANLFFLMGVLVAFGATLTLPGIAGIVLALTTAVDANVLIYERIREELALGKNAKKSVEEGFKHAFRTILDANITSFLVGFILFLFGTGPIKGFATTFIIGIFTSFITAVFLTRLMLENMAAKDKLNDAPFTTRLTRHFLQNLDVDFNGMRKYGYLITAAIIVISVVSFATLSFNQGIDFSGGRNYTVKLDKPASTVDVHDALEGQFDEGTALNVITIGSENQVRISTNYRITDTSDGVDTAIEHKLFEGLKTFINPDRDFDSFKADNIRSSQKVGPTVAADIRINSIWAIALAILGISLYILFRFKDVAFSLGTVASLAQVALVVIASYSLFHRIMPFTLEVNQHFVAAVMTAVSYAINDTVVIFDRIRENIALYPKREREWVINRAVNSTMSRTFSITVSTFLVLLLMFLFGGDVIRGFIFTLMIGVAAGPYSTIFLASPLAYDYYSWRENRKAKATAK